MEDCRESKREFSRDEGRKSGITWRIVERRRMEEKRKRRGGSKGGEDREDRRKRGRSVIIKTRDGR
jgi:hypothetical protein